MTPASALPLSVTPAATRSALRLPRRSRPHDSGREISFRRHNELPRASTIPAERDDHTSTAWQSPETVEHDDPSGEALFEETPAAEMSTSFFRREISFRRKKTMDGAPAAAERDFDAELSDAAEDHEDEPAEVVAEVVAEADEWAAPELVAALAVDADDSDGVDDAVVAEPVIAKAVPFYKRELGFRRSKTVAQEATVVVPADAVAFEDETSDDTTEVAAHADEPVVAWGRWTSRQRRRT